MKGNGHIGGKKYICASGKTPQNKLSETEGHFTTLGVTAFNGEPAVSVVIIMGKHNKAEVEIGIENFADIIGGKNDADCFERN